MLAGLTLLIKGGSNMTGTDLCVNKPHCTAAVQCGLLTYKSVPVIFEPPCTIGNRTRDLPACSAVPQRTAQPRGNL